MFRSRGRKETFNIPGKILGLLPGSRDVPIINPNLSFWQGSLPTRWSTKQDPQWGGASRGLGRWPLSSLPAKWSPNSDTHSLSPGGPGTTFWRLGCGGGGNGVPGKLELHLGGFRDFSSFCWVLVFEERKQRCWGWGVDLLAPAWSGNPSASQASLG